MMTASDQWILVAILIFYLAGLYWLGFKASQRVSNVEEYILAGRKLPWLLSVLTLTATWFGAESMMTTANEVSRLGIRRAMLDPFGIVLGLIFAGCFLAIPVRRLKALTIGDFFRERFGRITETIACWILIPSYFGWIAAQLMALAIVFETLLGLPISISIVLIAIIGSGYGLLGGMWSATWTDAAQILLIVLGLMVLTHEAMAAIGNGNWTIGVMTLPRQTPASFWRLTTPDQPWRSFNEALGALAIGALGNLPMQDLIQRLMSAKDERVARRACFGAAACYLGLGLMPLLLGMAGSLLIPQTEQTSDVVLGLGGLLLSRPMRMILVLAIVSAVLSTLVSAILSPAALLAHNLARPVRERQLRRPITDREGLQLQRASVLIILALSTGVALGGSSVYTLLEDSYALGLVGLAVPFLVGIRCRFGQQPAAIAAMIGGMSVWGVHRWLGWDWFLEPWWIQWPIPQEIGATTVSLIAYVVCMRLASPKAASMDHPV